MNLPKLGSLCCVRGCRDESIAWSPGEFRCLCRYHAESAAACGAYVLWIGPGASRIPYAPTEAVRDRRLRVDTPGGSG